VWSAIGTWFTAFIYIALFVYAIRQVSEASRLRRAQTRPFMVVAIEPGWMIFLSVENIGSTVARQVTFEFEPPLVSTLDEPWPFKESILLNEGIESVPPRRRHRIIFDSAISRMNSESLPKRHLAVVRYSDDEGHEYVDRYTLDLGAMMHTSPDEKGLPELVKEIEGIRKQLKRWTDGNRGLLVHARDRDAMIERQRVEIAEWRAAQGLASKEPPDPQEDVADDDPQGNGKGPG
jgi:hypothetical protein